MPNISVNKRGKSWTYRIYYGVINGKVSRFSQSGFATKGEARQAAEEMILQKAGMPVDEIQQAQSFTYAAYLDYWIANYCRINLKETTVSDYEKKIRNYIKPRIGDIPLSRLTTMALQTFLNGFFNDGYSRNEISCVKGILTSSLRFAVTPASLLKSNPATELRMPNARAKPMIPSRKKIREPINLEQWSRLIARFPNGHPSHIPLQLGYRLGLRLGEAFGVCWDDIDLDSKTLVVRHQVQHDDVRKQWYFTAPKYDSVRTVAIDSELVSLLRQEREKQLKAREYYGTRYHRLYIDNDNRLGDDGKEIFPVCVREDGSYIQPRTMQHICNVAHTDLDLPHFDFHTLRHTHATMLIDAGASLLDVKERLGHTSIDTTRIYTHNTDHLREKTRIILEEIYNY